MKGWPAVLALTLGCSSLTATAVDVRVMESVATVEGEVVGATSAVLVLLVSGEGTPESPFAVGDVTSIRGDGPYTLRAPAGSYWLTALEDRDGDGACDAGERAAVFGDEPIALAPGASRRMDLRFGALLCDPEISVEHEVPLHLGEVVTLREERFGGAAARMGVREPSRFLTTHGAGIYFTSPHQVARKPVLFIHGLGGSPANLAPLADALDPERFEAWHFHYPSGMRVADAARVLDRGLTQLRATLGYEQICIVAHSMGGLVARAYVSEPNQDRHRVRLLLTISSPMGGVASAATGVRMLAFPVPVWRDLSPDGEWLRALSSQPLPEGVRRVLIFGYSDGTPPSDGTIPLSSQLVPWAQYESDRVLGFFSTHMRILRLQAVRDVVTREVHTAVTAPFLGASAEP